MLSGGLVATDGAIILNYYRVDDHGFIGNI
jgi:hypothetical protein